MTNEATMAAARNVDGRTTVLLFDGFRLGGHRADAKLSGISEPDTNVVCAWDGRSFVKTVEGLFDEVLIHFGDQEIRLTVAPWEFLQKIQEMSPPEPPEAEFEPPTQLDILELLREVDKV